MRDAVRAGKLASAHDIAEGGLAVALAECCLAGGHGARIELADGADPEALFGESAGAFLISGAAEDLGDLANAHATTHDRRRRRRAPVDLGAAGAGRSSSRSENSRAERHEALSRWLSRVPMSHPARRGLGLLA